MKGCCLECPGWVPVTVLQFTCLSFLITYLYEVQITNLLCGHASSLESSVDHFRADCGLVMVEWAVSMHASHTAPHLQSQWTQTRREIPTPVGASDLISWAGPLPLTSKLEDDFWHEPLLPILLGVFITLPGTAQTHCYGTHLLLPFSPHFLMGCRTDHISVARQFITMYSCIGLAQCFENTVLFGWKTPYSNQRPHHLLFVMYPETPWRPIILCLLFRELGKIYANYLK